MRYNILIAIALLLTFSACEGSKKTNKKETAEVTNIIKHLNDQSHGYETFSARTKISVEDLDLPVSNIHAILRMGKGSVIWMSAKAMGIEGIRAKITPDSVYIIDRINKNYYVRSFDYVIEKTGLALEFAELQEWIVGNPVNLDPDSSRLMSENDYKLLVSTYKGMETILTIETQNYTIVNQQIRDLLNNRNALVSLNDYQEIREKPFSMLREIEVEAEEEFSFTVEFSKIEFDEELEYPFSISSKYSRVD